MSTIVKDDKFMMRRALIQNKEKIFHALETP
jgi:hypothetical protein